MWYILYQQYTHIPILVIHGPCDGISTFFTPAKRQVMWVSGEYWSGVTSSRRVHSTFQLLLHYTWPPDRNSPQMWMHFNNSDHQLFEICFSAWNTTSSSCFSFINLSGSVWWRLNQPTVRLISFNIPFQYSPKWNVRKLCLKLKTVRHTMAVEFNMLCHMSNWNLSKMTFTHRQTIVVLTLMIPTQKHNNIF